MSFLGCKEGRALPQERGLHQGGETPPVVPPPHPLSTSQRHSSPRHSVPRPQGSGTDSFPLGTHVSVLGKCWIGKLGLVRLGGAGLRTMWTSLGPHLQQLDWVFHFCFKVNSAGLNLMGEKAASRSSSLRDTPLSPLPRTPVLDVQSGPR